MFCPKCGKEVETEMRQVEETYTVKGDDITVIADVCFCKSCGDELWNEEFDEQNLLKAYTEYRRRHNLLQPEEIQAIREKYNLSQRTFARILGFGDKTITRYENGSIPDAAQNNLMMLVQDPNNFEFLLKKNREKLSNEEYQQAYTALEQLRCRVIYNKRQLYDFVDNCSNSVTLLFRKKMYWGRKMYA